MDRRAFLKLLTSGLVAPTVDVERLLWIPGQKTIFLPTFEETSFYGIPYHVSDETMGSWLGIERKIMLDKMVSLFERDDVFYKSLKEKYHEPD